MSFNVKVKPMKGIPYSEAIGGVFLARSCVETRHHIHNWNIITVHPKSWKCPLGSNKTSHCLFGMHEELLAYLWGKIKTQIKGFCNSYWAGQKHHHSILKHIDLHYHSIQEAVEDNKITISYIQQITTHLTYSPRHSQDQNSSHLLYYWGWESWKKRGRKNEWWEKKQSIQTPFDTNCYCLNWAHLWSHGQSAEIAKSTQILLEGEC